MEKLVFTDEDGTNVEFYVEEQTRINGRNYLLVTDAVDDSEEPEAYILKDMSEETDKKRNTSWWTMKWNWKPCHGYLNKC